MRRGRDGRREGLKIEDMKDKEKIGWKENVKKRKRREVVCEREW